MKWAVDSYAEAEEMSGATFFVLFCFKQVGIVARVKVSMVIWAAVV